MADSGQIYARRRREAHVTPRTHLDMAPRPKPQAGMLTLRQLLSQTRGLAGSQSEFYDLNQDHRITLAQSTAEAAACPRNSKPGEVFAYGGPGFQIAGAVADAVTGKRWS